MLSHPGVAPTNLLAARPEVARDRDTAPLSDAVRNDPRPTIALAAAIVTLLALARRVLS